MYGGCTFRHTWSIISCWHVNMLFFSSYTPHAGVELGSTINCYDEIANAAWNVIRYLHNPPIVGRVSLRLKRDNISTHSTSKYHQHFVLFIALI